MISDYDITGLSLLCSNLDCKLAAINREVKFIARTLARLRHRHHAALVFLHGKQPTKLRLSTKQAAAAGQIQTAAEDFMTTFLRKLFRSPRKDKVDDVESAPTTPIKEESERQWLFAPHIDPASTPTRSMDSLGSWTSSPTLPMVDLPVSLLPGSRHHSPAPRVSQESPSRPSLHRRCSGIDESLVTVIVDSESQSIFSVPRHHIANLTLTHKPETLQLPETTRRTLVANFPVTGFYLPNVSVADFHTFHRWTRTGRILEVPHNNAAYYIDYQARCVIAALALGMQLKSDEYQHAALLEFHALAPLLEWPEDYVNGVFAATKAGKIENAVEAIEHPARALIVAIVAAKTCGKGKRAVRRGPKDEVGEGGVRVRSMRFWQMYDEVCTNSGGQCDYPPPPAVCGQRQPVSVSSEIAR